MNSFHWGHSPNRGYCQAAQGNRADTRRGVQSPAANHQHRPSCLPPWSLRRDGQKRLEGLTIATLQQNTAQATMLIMARSCSVPSLQRGKVQSQDLGIFRVLLRGPGVALSGNAERFTAVGPIMSSSTGFFKFCWPTLEESKLRKWCVEQVSIVLFAPFACTLSWRLPVSGSRVRLWHRAGVRDSGQWLFSN